MKAIVFAGSSITWGEGLHYYSNLPHLNLSAEAFDRNDYTLEHIKFIEENRFSRLVANEFNTTDVVRYENGGTTKLMLEFINNDVDLTKCDYIIFQFTDVFRDLNKFRYKGEERLINIRLLHEIYSSEFDKYIMETWDYDLDAYIDYYISGQVSIIEENIKKFESKGIKKCFVLNETNEFYEYFKQNEFFNDRLITLGEYDTIEAALIADKIKIIAEDDTIINKYNGIVKDRHPNLETHWIIADNIINALKKHIKQ